MKILMSKQVPLTYLQMLADAAADPGRVNRTASRKIIPPRELKHADELQVVSNFDVLSCFLLFYLPFDHSNHLVSPKDL